MKRFFVLISLVLAITGCSTSLKGDGNNQGVGEEESTANNCREVSGGQAGTTNTVDYSDCFKGINGCAVFYGGDSYSLYNKEQCNTRYTPLSTFKIVATLEGISCGVLKSVDTKMNYSGYKYSLENWNENLNLEEAFKNSCVWYFRQVIDKIGQEKMGQALNELNYGNCDISQWEGVKMEDVPDDTNGFWLGSSLEISPLELVNVNYNIFEGNTKYNTSEIDLLTQIMESEKAGIYGKTGTGRDNSAWYTGYFEKNGENIYFAVHLDNKNGASVAGANAKEIAFNIIDKYFSE